MREVILDLPAHARHLLSDRGRKLVLTRGLERSDVAQMLAAQNRYRRQRGAPERTLEEALGHPSDGWEG